MNGKQSDWLLNRVHQGLLLFLIPAHLAREEAPWSRGCIEFALNDRQTHEN